MRKVQFLTIILSLLLWSGCKREAVPALIRMEYPETPDQVLKQFKGQVVYVDVLASWCKPCVEEFGHAAESDDFLAENKIAKLYITIDEPDAIEACFKLLEQHGMHGFFLSYLNPEGVSGEVTEYTRWVEKFFISYDEQGNMAGMSVPQYLIIDKKGNVVEYKAERPSHAQALKEQLSKYL
jgi:thiol-disulfide isomerase/thioredoxin